LKKKFLQYCINNKLHQNRAQLDTLDLLIKFSKKNNSLRNLIFKLFNKLNIKKGFYLHGDVGVGKTMLLNFFFDLLTLRKKRIHFNEFMINFHDFRHNNKLIGKKNSIDSFVKKLKEKIDLIYLDEFQVTNIVDAMILGKLFETIFKENIQILVTSNIKIDDLYKDGLQRDQFLPFIQIIKKFCIEHELIINKDYRKLNDSKLERFFHPLNEETSFQVSQIFRKLTKDKKKTIVQLNVKGRVLKINSFFDGHARFDFNELCSVNIGSEDYVALAKKCNFITLDNIPNFNDENSNLQQRFITLIDILYEKKISMMVSSNFNQKNFSSSKKLANTYKRTISRLFELTSSNFNSR
jgi:cell division protein ZapE